MDEEVNITIEKVKVTEEDKVDFFKSFLSDTPYVTTEKLFDGKFTLKFQALNVKQSVDVFDQLRKDQVNQDINSDANYMMALTNYRLGQAIIEINGEPFHPEITFEKYTPKGAFDTYIKEKALDFQKWPVFKLSAVAEAFKAFENKVIYLTKEIQTESFWKAGE